MRQSRVSVLIVSWNSRDLLVRCLTSLAALSCEVIVVDNASLDGSADIVARDFPNVVLLRNKDNLGFAAGVNAAARSASGDYLLLLNSDTEAGRGAVDLLADFLDATPACGAAAGRLVDENVMPQEQFGARRFPTLATCAVDLLLIDKLWPGNPVTSRYFARDLDAHAPVEIDQAAAACLMVRRAAFDQVGGLDEGFHPAWFEDVDFCRRLWRAGWRIALVPGAVFIHRGGVAMRALGLKDFSRTWYRNLERYFAKHHNRTQRAALKLLIVVGMLARLAISAVTADRQGLSAYWSVLRGTLTRSDG